MFKTNIETVPVGPFSGPMVCSMRPMTKENAQIAYDITVKMPNVHGAPVHMGDAAEVENAKPTIAITHAPGHMFITDIVNAELNDYLEEQKKKQS